VIGGNIWRASHGFDRGQVKTVNIAKLQTEPAIALAALVRRPAWPEVNGQGTTSTFTIATIPKVESNRGSLCN